MDKENSIVVHTPTIKDWEEAQELFFENGYSWASKKELKDYYNEYGSNTCIRGYCIINFNKSLTYCDKPFYDGDDIYTVISLKKLRNIFKCKPKCYTNENRRRIYWKK